MKADGKPRAYFNCKAEVKVSRKGFVYVPRPMQDLIAGFLTLFRQCRMTDEEITAAIQAAAAAYQDSYRASLRARPEPEPKLVNIFEGETP
jgi:hypothetical protein